MTDFLVTDRAGRQPLKDFLEATNRISDLRLLSEAEYLGRVLSFANVRAPEQLHALETELVSGLRPGETPIFFYALQAPLTAGLLQVQDRLRKQLELIRSTGSKAARTVELELRRAAEMIAIRPAYIATDSGVEVSYRYFPVNLEAAIGYGLVMLLDVSRPYGKDLCRCRLEECQAFFLAIRQATGRPRRDYCCEEHLNAAHNRDSTDRVRAHRKRKAVEKAKRHRGGRRPSHTQ